MCFSKLFIRFSGAFHIYVATDTEPTKRLVGQYEGSGSFGELALMYNMPRAATVQVCVFYAKEKEIKNRLNSISHYITNVECIRP